MKKGAAIGCGLVAVLVVVGLVAVVLSMTQYNRLVNLEEQVSAQWSQVENVYQRRADLIPNLVRTVEGAADFERGVLTDVIEARARATSVNVDPELLEDPQALQRFEQAQAQLGQALGRLLVVVERYPELKANQSFIQLQDELAGTENRIAVERRRFNQVAQEYNATIRRFPTNLVAGVLGFGSKAYFEATPGAERPPEVEFEFQQPR